jgi:cysteine desulfurase
VGEVIYLDHAATTPIDPSVLAEMRPYLEAEYGNPSSAHARGRAARQAVEVAREQVAAALGVVPLEVVFTSGGTEADNAAVKGVAWSAREAGRGAHVVTTAIEHHAVLDAVGWLADHAGFAATVVPVAADGRVDADRLLDAVRTDTVLVSVMAANNEIGTLQPLADVGPALAERGVPLHTDAVQAFGRVDLDLDGWGIGALSLSAHKFNGPKGVGALVLRRDLPAQPLLHGGGQERDVRSGTLNAAGIVGCGAAAELTMSDSVAERARLRGLRDRLLEGLLGIDGVTVNGSLEHRLPHNLNVAVDGCEGASLLAALDMAGVCASAGSACQSGATSMSHVLSAIGASPTAAHMRLVCGRTTTADQVERSVTIVTDRVKRLRDAGGGFV